MKSTTSHLNSISVLKSKAMAGAKLIVEKTFEQMICVTIMALIELLRH